MQGEVKRPESYMHGLNKSRTYLGASDCCGARPTPGQTSLRPHPLIGTEDSERGEELKSTGGGDDEIPLVI